MNRIAELGVVEDDGVVIAAVSGDIDASNTADLQIQIAGSVPNTALGLVLDLTETAYLDSTGVKLVFDLGSRLQVRQQVLCIVVPESGVVARVLEMVGARSALNVHSTREAAIAQIRGSGSASIEDLLSELN